MAIHLESQQLIVLIYYPHTIKYEDRWLKLKKGIP
jgi:hypothetical protein